jgi:hypothetical protein
MRRQSISAIPAPAAPVFPPDGSFASGSPRTESTGGDTAFLGILMLQTRFPRLPGDIGHPASFPVPTRRWVVGGATATKVVRDAAGLAASGLLDDFIAAARRLEAQGARAITTSCGFLVLFQRELQAAVRVPLVTSSLVLLPPVLAREGQAGLLTISAENLGPDHLLAAGVPRDKFGDVIIEGMPPAGEFAAAILGDRPQMDAGKAAAEVVAAALRLQRRAPQLRTLVLECTNLPPYAAAIEQATGLRTVSLLQCETLMRPFGRIGG